MATSGREINEELNALIRKAQGSRSQNQFSRNCGVSSSNLTRILNGERNPTPEVLQRIAASQSEVTYDELMRAAFGCSLSDAGAASPSPLPDGAPAFLSRFAPLLEDPGFLAVAELYRISSPPMRDAVLLQTAGLAGLFGIDSGAVLKECGAAEKFVPSE